MNPVEMYGTEHISTHDNEYSINLALRRTADLLLRGVGDHNSHIPSVSNLKEGIWEVMIPNEFSYDSLPSVLQSSLDIYGIKDVYQVSVLNCTNKQIVLGYHKLDFFNQKNVPCQGRPMDEGCHYLQIKFVDKPTSVIKLNSGIYLGILLIGLFTSGIWYMKKHSEDQTQEKSILIENAIKFGNSTLDVENQMLISHNKTQKLTFRETKLLELFVTNVDKLLDRDTILQRVWADEGVLVSRSIDVFVSRLRKKLNYDPSLRIAVVHGVGYRLESSE